jgi:hypothetical protein
MVGPMPIPEFLRAALVGLTLSITALLGFAGLYEARPRAHDALVTSATRHYPPPEVPGALIDPQPSLAALCTPGYSKSVRPPSSYTTSVKRRQMRQWHRGEPTAAYTEDHLLALELGGEPRAEANLWPEPVVEARQKDRDENSLHRAVCAGRMSLRSAQQRMIDDWGPR